MYEIKIVNSLGKWFTAVGKAKFHQRSPIETSDWSHGCILSFVWKIPHEPHWNSYSKNLFINCLFKDLHCSISFYFILSLNSSFLIGLIGLLLFYLWFLLLRYILLLHDLGMKDKIFKDWKKQSRNLNDELARNLKQKSHQRETEKNPIQECSGGNNLPLIIPPAPVVTRTNWLGRDWANAASASRNQKIEPEKPFWKLSRRILPYAFRISQDQCGMGSIHWRKILNRMVLALIIGVGFFFWAMRDRQ